MKPRIIAKRGARDSAWIEILDTAPKVEKPMVGYIPLPRSKVK